MKQILRKLYDNGADWIVKLYTAAYVQFYASKAENKLKTDVPALILKAFKRSPV